MEVVQASIYAAAPGMLPGRFRLWLVEGKVTRIQTCGAPPISCPSRARPPSQTKLLECQSQFVWLPADHAIFEVYAVTATASSFSEAF